LQSNDLVAALQQVKEFKLSITRLESLLQSAKEENIEQVKLAAQQANKYRIELAALEAKISELKELLSHTEAMNVDLRHKLDLERKNIRSVEMESEHLRICLAEHKTSHQQTDSLAFGDFVKLKRQLVMLQDENDRLNETLRSKFRSGTSGLQVVDRNTPPQTNKSCITATKSLIKSRPKVQKDQ